MSESVRKTLREELGTAPPAFLDDLDEVELVQLARALSEARTRQTEAVEEAIGSSLWFLPWGLRGAVRKALLG